MLMAGDIVIVNSIAQLFPIPGSTRKMEWYQDDVSRPTVWKSMGQENETVGYLADSASRGPSRRW